MKKIEGTEYFEPEDYSLFVALAFIDEDIGERQAEFGSGGRKFKSSRPDQ